MADIGNKKQRALTALDEFRLRLVGDIVNGAKRQPTMGFTVHRNEPQIVVRTNVEGDKNYGKITSQLDTPTFFAIIAKLEETIASEPDTKVIVKNLAPRFMNGKRSDPMPDTTIIIGKDKEGIVYIAMTSWEKDRPIIKFPFRPTHLHSFVNADGTPVPAGKLSELYAKAWLQILYGLVPHLLVTEYTPPPPREGGSWGGKSEATANGSSSNAAFANEWPM